MYSMNSNFTAQKCLTIFSTWASTNTVTGIKTCGNKKKRKTQAPLHEITLNPVTLLVWWQNTEDKKNHPSHISTVLKSKPSLDPVSSSMVPNTQYNQVLTPLHTPTESRHASLNKSGVTSKRNGNWLSHCWEALGHCWGNKLSVT